MQTQKYYPLLLKPVVKDYVWGGRAFEKFVPNDYPANAPIAEIWAIYAKNIIQNGALADKTLDEAASIWGIDLLGSKQNAQDTGFPILIKLLDCNQWLSVQVHPNNEQALMLEGVGQRGKTEAWFILQAQSAAKLLAGTKKEISQKQLTEAILNGNVIEVVKEQPIQTHDFIRIPAGTIHALGPGALVYEIQQSSDITYRVFDWDRPASEGRTLHLQQSIMVTKADASVSPLAYQPSPDNPTKTLVQNEYFHLEILDNPNGTLELNTYKESFHALTAIEGEALLKTKDGSYLLKKYESILIPAAVENYQLEGAFMILKASL